MKTQSGGCLSFFALLWFSAAVDAAQLTVCGVLDGAAGDSNPLTGVVTTSCAFGATGSFNGTVSESTDPLNYTVVIRGSFKGAGSMASFITGAFTLSGIGDLYPFIPFGGRLEGPTSVLAGSGDFFQVSAAATNIPGNAAGLVTPVQPGLALPQALTSSLGNLTNGVFSGAGTLSVGISFQADPSATFVFNAGSPTVLASTDSIHVIPEPSTAPLLGAALGVLLWRLRRAVTS